jgi:acetyl esterase/lipase
MLNNSPAITTVVLLAVAALSGCYTHLNGQPGEPSGQVSYSVDQKVENIIYTSSEWPEPLEADLYLPKKRGLRPVVLMIHGGGWANRSRDDMSGISHKLMQQGYAVLNVNYRFAPRYTYPAQLHDLQQALEWISENANRYRLDLERVNTWGYSSGAHLAALIASIEQDRHSSTTNYQLPRIRSVVAGGIPSDLRKYTGSPIVMRFMGGDNDEMPERYAEASPAFHVSSDDPPVFLYHGKLDFLVTEDQAVDYYETLRAAGVDAELYLHRWRGHMSMFLFGGDAEDKAIAFLSRNNSTSQYITAEHN